MNNTKTVLKFEKSITEGHLITSYEDGVLTLDNGVKLDLGAGINIEDLKIEGNELKVTVIGYPKEVLPENIEEIMKSTDYFTEIVESIFIKIKREFSKGSLTSVFDDDYCYVVDRFGYMLTSIWFDDELQDVNAELREVNKEIKEVDKELEVNKELKKNKKEVAKLNKDQWWAWLNSGDAYKVDTTTYVYDYEKDIKYIKEELGVDAKLSDKEIQYKVLVHNALIFYKKLTGKDQVHLANIRHLIMLYLTCNDAGFEVKLVKDLPIIKGVCGYFDGAYLITHYGAPGLKLSNGDAYTIKVGREICDVMSSYILADKMKSVDTTLLLRLAYLNLLYIEDDCVLDVKGGLLKSLEVLEAAEQKVNRNYVGVARMSYDVFNHRLSKLGLKIDKED